MPLYYCQKIADEEVQKLVSNDQDTINFSIFSEIYAKLAFKWVENTDLKSSIAFVQMLFERTTIQTAIHIKDK